ncbi:dienelactone hydrolase family protein [Polyangium sp. 15x6]|uniref:dienelactone hydrolase family protein n=1 Tax=Polyangium sp. 15x6 TaxID=3042687 RepID=UPI00249C0153|nr:dienelactone hydrolase family protein [Polyangium sp. 15x6]MDI3287034.1 dienelactone hydrolase family protein [Polyangium sp. 15x6]
MSTGTTKITRQVLSVEGEQLPLTIARSSGVGAALVILPSAFGVAPDLEAQMEELGADASLVVTFDPFFRTDSGHAPYDDMARVMARVKGVQPERIYRDLRALIEWARAESRGRPVVMLGICFGGPFAFRAAADGLVSGVVTWHGTGLEKHLDRVVEMRCPMRLHFGSVDPFVPPPAVEAVRAAFAGRDDVQVFVHEGATHGFSHPAAVKAYNETAERAAMSSLRELVAAVGSQA